MHVLLPHKELLIWTSGLAVWIVSCVLQYTEEKLGQAEKTELDAHLENLIARADCTKNWTEKIFRQTEVLLQPNPSKNLHGHFMFKILGHMPKPLYCIFWKKIFCYWIWFEMWNVALNVSENVSCCWHFPLTWWTGACVCWLLNQFTLMSPFGWLHHKKKKRLIWEIKCLLNSCTASQWNIMPDNHLKTAMVLTCHHVRWYHVMWMQCFTRVLRWTSNWQSG